MILLTFNILNNHSKSKNNRNFSAEELLEITEINSRSILRILENHNIKSTFFIDVSIAEQLDELIKKIISKGHEISLYNAGSNVIEIDRVKKNIEAVTGKIIRGFRQKENILNASDLKPLEFTYISNIENTNILFPLRRLQRSSEIIEDQGISIIPETISPYSQLPYNDFVFQVMPSGFYNNMVMETVKNQEYCLIYLNSWQFTDFERFNFRIPFYRKYSSGKKMEDKLEGFLQWMNGKEMAAIRMKDFIF